MARLPKKQDNLTYVERKQLIETDKDKDISAVIMKKYKVLMEIQDLMFEEIRESLKNDLKQNLAATSIIPEMKNSDNSRSRKDWQQVKELASQTTHLVEKMEGKKSKIVEDIVNLIHKREEMNEFSSRLDESEENRSNKGQKSSQNQKVSVSVEEALYDVDDRYGKSTVHIEDEEDESTKSEEVKEMGEEKNIQSFRSEKCQKAPREWFDEGAILTLAADLSSATLGVSGQWGNIFRILKENDLEPTFLCDVKLAFKCDGETKTFSNLQSLREFISQKPFMKELLQDIFPQNEKVHRGRRYGIQEKLGKTSIDSKPRAGEPSSDGLSFLFIKEVKIAKPEVKSIESEEEESSELEEKGTPKLEEQEASWVEEEWEETSWLEEEEEGEEASGMEEEEGETSELEEEGEDTIEKSYNKCEEPSCINLSTSSGIATVLKKTEKEKHKTLKLEELTAKEADLLQETEESFRKSVVHLFREIQEEIENIKHFHPEVVEIKDSVNDLSNRMDILEERVDSLDDQVEEFSKDAMQMAKQIINKERLRDIEDRSRSANIRLIGIPEKENKENSAEDIIREIVEENFPELKKDSSLEIVSAHRIPSKIDENRFTPRHILVKFCNSSDKEKIIKVSRERKEITYRGTRIRLTADLSLGTLDARSKWANIIKVLQEKGFKPRILYPAKLAFDFEGKTKVFFDIEEFRTFVSCVSPLKELLENVLSHLE